MKITVKPKPEDKDKTINYDDIEPGMVFEYKGGCRALKLIRNGAVLLTHSGLNATMGWLDIAVGFKIRPIKRILGRLDEIIVVLE